VTLDVRGLAPLVQVYDMPTSVRFYRDLLGFQIMRTSPVLGGDGMCSRDRLHLPRPAFAGEFTCPQICVRTKPLARRTLRVRLCLPKIASGPSIAREGPCNNALDALSS